MICRNGLPGGSRRQRTTVLLSKAREQLAQWHRLHLLSVSIGRMEELADCGVIDREIREARALIESADRLCADISRHQSHITAALMEHRT